MTYLPHIYMKMQILWISNLCVYLKYYLKQRKRNKFGKEHC